MGETDSSSSLSAVSWVGPPALGSKPRVFKHTAQGTTVATGCVKTKEGDLTEHNANVLRHRELAMSTRR
jgi:hypothetical protein